MTNHILEICAYNIESALIAAEAGADRIELCDNINEGGTTPGPGTIISARKHLKNQLFIMIRPRGGDFYYTDTEFECMKEDVLYSKNAGADGVVFGILTREGKVDTERCKILTELAYPLKVTFHRAFDMTRDPFEAVDDIAGTGIERILTSGCRNKAEEGLELISRLVNFAAGKISIMAGSGINLQSVEKIISRTKVKEIHLSAKKYFSSEMSYINNKISMGNKDSDEYRILKTDYDLIKQIKELMNKQIKSI